MAGVGLTQDAECDTEMTGDESQSSFERLPVPRRTIPSAYSGHSVFKADTIGTESCTASTDCNVREMQEQMLATHLKSSGSQLHLKTKPQLQRGMTTYRLNRASSSLGQDGFSPRGSVDLRSGLHSSQSFRRGGVIGTGELTDQIQKFKFQTILRPCMSKQNAMRVPTADTLGASIPFIGRKLDEIVIWASKKKRIRLTLLLMWLSGVFLGLVNAAGVYQSVTSVRAIGVLIACLMVPGEVFPILLFNKKICKVLLLNFETWFVLANMLIPTITLCTMVGSGQLPVILAAFPGICSVPFMDAYMPHAPSKRAKVATVLTAFNMAFWCFWLFNLYFEGPISDFNDDLIASMGRKSVVKGDLCSGTILNVLIFGLRNFAFAFLFPERLVVLRTPLETVKVAMTDKSKGDTSREIHFSTSRDSTYSADEQEQLQDKMDRIEQLQDSIEKLDTERGSMWGARADDNWHQVQKTLSHSNTGSNRDSQERRNSEGLDMHSTSSSFHSCNPASDVHQITSSSSTVNRNEAADHYYSTRSNLNSKGSHIPTESQPSQRFISLDQMHCNGSATLPQHRMSLERVSEDHQMDFEDGMAPTAPAKVLVLEELAVEPGDIRLLDDWEQRSKVLHGFRRSLLHIGDSHEQRSFFFPETPSHPLIGPSACGNQISNGGLKNTCDVQEYASHVMSPCSHAQCNHTALEGALLTSRSPPQDRPRGVTDDGSQCFEKWQPQSQSVSLHEPNLCQSMTCHSNAWVEPQYFYVGDDENAVEARVRKGSVSATEQRRVERNGEKESSAHPRIHICSSSALNRYGVAQSWLALFEQMMFVLARMLTAAFRIVGSSHSEIGNSNALSASSRPSTSTHILTIPDIS